MVYIPEKNSHVDNIFKQNAMVNLYTSNQNDQTWVYTQSLQTQQYHIGWNQSIWYCLHNKIAQTKHKYHILGLQLVW